MLMDVPMPETDGIEATAAIRQHEKNTRLHTAIIALTANAMKGDREKYLASGMDGYLADPSGRSDSTNSSRVRLRGEWNRFPSTTG